MWLPLLTVVLICPSSKQRSCGRVRSSTSTFRRKALPLEQRHLTTTRRKSPLVTTAVIREVTGGRCGRTTLLKVNNSSTLIPYVLSHLLHGCSSLHQHSEDFTWQQYFLFSFTSCLVHPLLCISFSFIQFLHLTNACFFFLTKNISLTLVLVHLAFRNIEKMNIVFLGCY